MPATHTRLRTPGPTHEPQGLAPLRRELVAQNRRLRETLLNLDNLISPADWLDAGDGFPGFGTWRWNRPATRAQDRTHAPLSYLNEEEWRHHVALARDLVTRNHLALGFRDHVANFVGPVTVAFVLKGQAPGASASGPIDADGDGEPDLDPIVKEATQAWDEWRELAQWGEGEHDREAECRTRLIVEGECTLRFFTGNADSNGLPHVRHVEPELIRTPPGHDTTDSWGWGIKCADDDDECEDALWLCRPDNPNDGREVAASEYVRAKANVDRTVKRGLSDFFSVAEHLRKVLGLLDNMGHVARLQSAIAWWEQYPNATEAQVRAMIQSGTDYSRPKLAPGAPARTTDVQNYEPGSVIRTEAGRQVQPGPVATGVAGYAQVEALLLRAVGFRWGCPSYFSGDADASFASVLVTGSPFVRITEARQEKVKGFARAVARRVLEFCERTGRLPRGTTQRVRPIATARPVVIADEEKQARTFLALYQQNCADPIDFMRKRGDDPKVVAANIAAWHKKFPPPGTGPDALPVGDDLTTSPPGSAGGDGTSPNDDQRLGEAHGRCACEELTTEAQFVRSRSKWTNRKKTGKFRDKHGHEYCLSNGRHVPCSGQSAKPTNGPNLAHAVKPGVAAVSPPSATTAASAGAPGGTPPGGSGPTLPLPYDANKVGKKIKKLLPTDKQLDNQIRKRKGNNNKFESQWEEVLAQVLGPGWVRSGTTNSPEDVKGSLVNKDGVKVHVLLDGKMVTDKNQAYSIKSSSTHGKLVGTTIDPDSIVCYAAVKYIPHNVVTRKKQPNQPEDGVYLQFGTPKTLSLADGATRDPHLGPFQLFTRSDLDLLRSGDAGAVNKLRQGIHDKIYNLDLKAYQTAETNAAFGQTQTDANHTKKTIAAAKFHGVDDIKIANELSSLTTILSDDGKTKHAENAIRNAPSVRLNDLGKQIISAMSDEQRQEFAQLLAKHNTTPPQ